MAKIPNAPVYSGKAPVAQVIYALKAFDEVEYRTNSDGWRRYPNGKGLPEVRASRSFHFVSEVHVEVVEVIVRTTLPHSNDDARRGGAKVRRYLESLGYIVLGESRMSGTTWTSFYLVGPGLDEWITEHKVQVAESNRRQKEAKILRDETRAQIDALLAEHGIRAPFWGEHNNEVSVTLKLEDLLVLTSKISHPGEDPMA